MKLLKSLRRNLVRVSEIQNRREDFRVYCPNLNLEKIGDPFTPLESPAACSGDEDNFLMRAKHGV